MAQNSIWEQQQNGHNSATQAAHFRAHPVPVVVVVPPAAIAVPIPVIPPIPVPAPGAHDAALQKQHATAACDSRHAAPQFRTAFVDCCACGKWQNWRSAHRAHCGYCNSVNAFTPVAVSRIVVLRPRPVPAAAPANKHAKQACLACNDK